jgi:spore coat polysaccharide biosynthesis protein SpsF
MIGCIIQARLDSSRLPGKVLLEIENKKSVLFFVIEQLKKCILLDDIVVATSNKPKDDGISKFCEKNEIKCFRGNDKNVLDRYYQCAKKFEFSVIVRVPADKPLIDPEIVDLAIKKFVSNTYDYVTNFLPLTYPSGTEVEVLGCRL